MASKNQKTLPPPVKELTPNELRQVVGGAVLTRPPRW
jgi:hypothetical protein